MSASDNVESFSDTISVSIDSTSSSDSSGHRELLPLDNAKSGVWDSLLQMATLLREIRRNVLKYFVNCVRKSLTTKGVPQI